MKKTPVKNSKNSMAAFGLLLALAACADDLPPPAPVSQAMQPKVMLDVQAITLADRTEIQPINSPYNGNHFTPTINDAIRKWASDRLQAAGQTGQAIVLIKDATLTAQPLAKREGIDTIFTRQRTLKYTGHAEVSIEANGKAGFATADADATRSVTLPENPTDTERQEAYYNLLNGLMKDLSANLDTAIQYHMAPFITAAPSFGTTSIPTPMVSAPMAASMPMATSMDAPVVTVMPTMMAPSLPPAPPEPASVAPASRQPAVIPLSGSSR